MSPSPRRFALLAAFVALVSSPMQAQDSRDGKFVLAADGSLLWVEVPAGNVSDLVYRSPGGVDTTLVDEGDCVIDCAGTPLLLNGIGAFPHMNNTGTVVFQGNVDVALPGDDETRSALFVQAVGDASPTLIARGHYTSTTAGERTLVDGDGDGTADDGICDIEPMPIINATGQVAFGVHARRNNTAQPGGSRCSDFTNAAGDTARLSDEFKDVLRWSSGTGIQVLLRSNRVNSDGDSLVVGAGASIPAGTYEVTDADVINNVRKDSMNANGLILARGQLDDDPTDDACQPDCTEFFFGTTPSAHDDDRVALMLVTDATTRALVAGTGADTSSDPFQTIEDGVLNNSAQVLYKGEARTDNGSAFTCGRGRMDDFDDEACEIESDAESLNLWTSGGGSAAIVSSGDSVPGGSTANFLGFGPRYDLNNGGDVAFLGSMDLGGACDTADIITGSSGNNNSTNLGNTCHGVYFYDGTLTEIARSTTADSQDASGGTSSTLGGFDFEMIAATVMLQDDSSVYFMAENEDVPGAGCTLPDMGGEQTMIVGWSPVSGGLQSILRENQLLTGGERVIRIYPPEQSMAVPGSIFIKADLAAAGDCVRTSEEIIQIAGVPGVIDEQSVLEIPVLGRLGVLVLALLLIGSAARMLRRDGGISV